MQVALKLSTPLLIVWLFGGLAGSAPAQQPAQALQGLGPQFVVFRDKVQEELKLSEDQKQKLETRLQETIQETMRFFEEIPEEERGKKAPGYREKAQKKLASFLKETLKEDQLKRLREIGYQQEGLLAVGQPEVAKELKISDEQKKKLMSIHQELQKKAEAFMKEVQSGGSPDEIMPKMMKLRKEQEGKIDAILTDAQKKRWKEMLGKPFNFED